MSDPLPEPDRRWPRQVYGVGDEPDPRFTLANERTFLAWIRTALGFMAGAIAIATVGQIAAAWTIELQILAAALAVCGVVCAGGGYLRWMAQERAIRLGRPLPATRAMPFVSAVLVLVAIAGLAVLFF